MVAQVQGRVLAQEPGRVLAQEQVQVRVFVLVHERQELVPVLVVVWQRVLEPLAAIGRRFLACFSAATLLRLMLEVTIGSLPLRQALDKTSHHCRH